ncbi:MFS transporter [Amphritea sp. 2_MG-2023]|uniref:MFS transporter n=1 Tax=Amphritea TaxID=515417 RepID=UPI001C06FDD3|nr:MULTISPECIES: MFS transporter [Amphritea]MBU2967408.1 MFS transporter [Amphritea atlantica]MDO6418337.1 MFS transporter [Amphritea sp. 2_MG-2023]
MRMTATFGINQIISHGFGVFLFAALVPLMQESIAISHWYLATIGALTQLAYLGGAMLLGLIGHRIDSGRLVLITGALTSTLLLIMATLDDPMLVLLVLIALAASAAISWGAIVELITRYAHPTFCSTSLSSASSGTAWGYGLNGLLILLIVPLFGWRSGWLLAGMLGCTSVILTIFLLRHLKQRTTTSSGGIQAALPAGQLFRIIAKERAAFFACLICFMIGFATMPFSTWLNTYLAELTLPPALGGYTWTVSGITGMVAGFFSGKLADSKGHGIALLIIFSGFCLGQLAFIYDPASFAVFAGFGYGLMYFPMWGIIAGWVNQHYSSTATMQISGIGMVTFGLGGALGNLLAGFIQSASGSLAGVYWIISIDAVLLVGVAIYICLTELPAVNLTAQNDFPQRLPD